jgi:hypothetical protein
VSTNSSGSFATLTHARLRASQGDVAGAVRILRVILDVQPGHDEARALLAELSGRMGVPHREPEDVAPLPVKAATADGLARRFRGMLSADGTRGGIDRLSAWLTRVERNRGSRHDQ